MNHNNIFCNESSCYATDYEIKKIFPLLFSLCALLLLASCDSRGDVQDAPDAAGTAATEAVPPDDGMTDKLYVDTFYPFSGEYTVTDAARIGNRLLLLGQVIAEDRDEDADILVQKAFRSALRFADYALDDTGRASLTLGEEVAAGEDTILSVAAGGDGSFYALAAAAGEDGGADCALLRYDEQGQTLGSVSFFLPTPPWFIGDLQVTEDGTAIINGYTVLYVLSGGEVTAIDAEAGISDVFLTGEGALYSDMDRFYQVDSGTRKDSGIDAAGDGPSYAGGRSCQGLDGELVVELGKSFYLYGGGETGWTELLQCRGSGWGPSCRLGEDDFLLTNGSEVLTVTGMERVPWEEDTRSVVNVVVLGNYLPKEAADDPVYDYRETHYCVADGTSTDVTGWQDAQRLLVEMNAGKVPDLILYSEGALNTDSDMFEDLYPYLDADPDLNRDSFLPHFLDALSINGELHQIWESTWIHSVWGPAEVVGDGTGFTCADYSRMAAQSDAYNAVLPYDIGYERLLGDIAEFAPALFVDRENAQVHFDDPVFAQLLAWCPEMGPDSVEGVGRPDGRDYLTDRPLLDTVTIFRVLDIAQQEKTQNHVPVGYPDGDGGVNYYRPMDGGHCMAIPAGSQNKEGAWAYIRSRLLLETQLELGRRDDWYLFPVNSEAVRRLAEAKLESEAQTLLWELLERTRYAQTSSDHNLEEIIVSAGQMYLAGDRSLEDMVDLIQSKAAIYVAERYG